MRTGRATLWIRRIAALVGGWLALSAAPALRAQEQEPQPARDALARCSGDLAGLAISQGARTLVPARRAFLLAGDQRSFEIDVPHEGCVHVAIVGQRNIQDLDLAVFDASGRKLAFDRNASAHPYASFCGHAGRGTVAHVTMLDGNGEIELSTFAGGPRRLHGLDAVAAACESSGAPRPHPLDVGQEPPGTGLEQGLSRARQSLGDLGYAEGAAMAFGALTEQHREARRLVLGADQCFALLALGSSAVNDVDLRVFAPAGDPQVLASDMTRRRDALVKLCTDDRGGDYLLDIRMFRGAGTYVVKSFVLDERVATPVGVRGAARIEYQELARRMAARGLAVQPLGWSLVRPLHPDRTALELEAGECYALGAVGSAELPSSALELSLLDDRGRVVASRQGASDESPLFHCAERSGSYRAAASSHELRRAGRYLLVLGRAAREHPTP